MFIYYFRKCRIGFLKATLANGDTEHGLSLVMSDDNSLFKEELKRRLKSQKKVNGGEWVGKITGHIQQVIETCDTFYNNTTNL